MQKYVLTKHYQSNRRKLSLMKSILSWEAARRINVCSVFEKISTATFPLRVFRDCSSENHAGPGPAAEIRNTPGQTSYLMLGLYHPQRTPAGCQGWGIKVWRRGCKRIRSHHHHHQHHPASHKELLARRHFSITQYDSSGLPRTKLNLTEPIGPTTLDGSMTFVLRVLNALNHRGQYAWTSVAYGIAFAEPVLLSCLHFVKGPWLIQLHKPCVLVFLGGGKIFLSVGGVFDG